MRMRPLLLEAATSRNRFAVMSEVDDWIASSGGWIEGHSLYSNLVITFRFVVPADALSAIEAALDARAIRLDEPSQARIADLAASGQPLAGDLPGSLAVSFIHDEPDLRREVPAVPG